MQRFMINPKYLRQACKKIERHLKQIEGEYKRKNIEHRLIEDQGYNFYKGKLFAYKWVLENLG